MARVARRRLGRAVGGGRRARDEERRARRVRCGDRRRARCAARGRFVSDQLHVPAAFRCVRRAARAVSPPAGAPAGALRRARRAAGRRVDRVVLARAVRREDGRVAARAADERHRASLGRSARGCGRRALSRERCEESRRERDDRRSAAQRSRAHRAHRIGDGAGVVLGRAVCVGVADDVDGRGGHRRRRDVRRRAARALSVRLDHGRAEAQDDATDRCARDDAARALYGRDRLARCGGACGRRRACRRRVRAGACGEPGRRHGVGWRMRGRNRVEAGVEACRRDKPGRRVRRFLPVGRDPHADARRAVGRRRAARHDGRRRGHRARQRCRRRIRGVRIEGAFPDRRRARLPVVRDDARHA
ncbi:putative para-aminobenzoate synthase, component I [Burkholderia pseudomallei MSHR684]|nr:putative para-aminobenzoate synthase, component I [Burkholderia pseudomallei MSHR684]